MELPFEKLPDALDITLKVPVEGPNNNTSRHLEMPPSITT